MRKVYLVDEPDSSFIPYAVETADTERRLLSAYPNARRVTQREYRAMGRNTSRKALDELVGATLDELTDSYPTSVGGLTTHDRPRSYVDLQGTVVAAAVVTAKMQMTTAMSRVYLHNAARFARQAKGLESQGLAVQDSGSNFDDEHYRGDVIAAIAFSAFFLEAAIHEFLTLKLRQEREFAVTLREQQIAVIERYWQQNASKWIEVVDRYNAVLLHAGVDALDKGQRPAQPVTALTHLRNALLHYNPTWEGDNTTPRNVETELEQMFSERNPFRKPTGVRFPNYYLSHACATWAVDSALAFYREFCSRIHYIDRYTPSDPMLATS